MKPLLIVLMLTVFWGCDSKSSSPGVTETTECSTENPSGTCSSPEDYCYRGNCIQKGAKCGEIAQLAPCYQKDDKGEYVLDNNDQPVISTTEVCEAGGDGTFSCVNGPCKFNHTTGTCPEGKYCDGGFCTYYCSAKNPYGKCENESDICGEGTCYPVSQYCSKENLSGTCPEEKTCIDGICWPVCGTKYPFGNCITDGALDKNKECSKSSCVELCSELYPGGKCFMPSDECRSGKCVSPCSVAAPDGFCDTEDVSCIAGKCQKACSPSEPEGGCEWGHDCYAGSCQQKCSLIAPNGYCTEEGTACNQGRCEGLCSESNPDGPCASVSEYCDAGVCKKHGCSAQYPEGVCDNPLEQCVQIDKTTYECKKECSPDSVQGFCTQDGYRCSREGSCVVEADQLCDEWFLNGYCEDRNKVCQSGVCVLGPCSTEHPAGYCSDDAQECQNGTCQTYTCIDNRPINLAEPRAACCRTDQDCGGNQGTSIGFCIEDRHPEGPYCLVIEAFGAGCSTDQECKDIYGGSEYDGGNQEDWVCINAIAPGFGSEVSFCQRVEYECTLPENEQRLDLGEECGSECIETKCKSGTYCFRGACTSQCSTSDRIFENPACPEVEINGEKRFLDCMPQSFDVSGKSIGFEGCVVGCTSHNDCLIRPGHEASGSGDTDGTFCNTATKLEIGTQKRYHLVCDYPYFNKRKRQWAQCEAQEECGTGACDSLLGICHNPCAVDGDCGTNQYCSFESKILENRDVVDLLGVCRNLETSVEDSECKTDSDCGANLFCIPKVLEDNTIKRFCGRATIPGWTPVEYNTQKCGVYQRTSCNNNICYGETSTDRYCRMMCETKEQCGTGFDCKEVTYRSGTANVVNANISKGFVNIKICLPE